MSVNTLLCQRTLLALLAGFVVVLLAAGCTSPHVRRAEQFAGQGKWDEAVTAYRKAQRENAFDKEIAAALANAKARASEQHYAQGMTAMQEGQVALAVQEFQWAVGFMPSRRENHVALGQALRQKEARNQLRSAQKLQYLGRLDDAMVAYERAVVLDPDLDQAVEGITTVTTQRQAARSMAKSNQPVTLRFQRAKLREVFEILARTAGVNVVFDKDVKDDPVTIFLKDMPYDDALKLILNTHNLSAHRVTGDTVLIAPNTRQKQAHYQDLMIRTFYLSNAEAKKVVNLLRSMLESKRVFADEQVNAVVVRDTPAKLHLAERVIYSIDQRQPEVMLEVEVLEVDRSKSMEYGLSFAKTAGASMVPTGFTGIVTDTAIQMTLQQLKDLGDENYVFTFPGSVFLDFFKQEANAKVLLAPKLRVVNREKATINVGDKQPILLSTTNVLPGQAATGSVPTTSTVTSTEFKDTGIKLTVEPVVHLMDDLTLKIKIEVTVLGERVILQESPLITQFRFGTRVAETTLRLHDDQTVILGGLISDTRRRTKEGVSFLKDDSLLDKLLSAYDKELQQTELVIAITPRVIRGFETPGAESQAFWSGTQRTFSTGRLFSPEPPMIHQTSTPATPTQEGYAPEVTRESHAPAASPAIPGDSQSRPEDSPTPPETSAAPSSSTTVDASRQGTVTAGGAGVLAIQPSRLLAKVGQHFRVDVMADQIGNFTESVMTISYDPTLLEFIRGAAGPVLSRGAGPSGASVAETPEKGQIVLKVQRQSQAPAVTGSLATLFFRAKSQGTAHLALKPTQLSGPEKNQSFTVTAKSGSVVVQ